MRLFLLGFFFSGLLANITNDQPQELDLEKYNATYMAELTIAHDEALLAQRGRDPLSISILGDIVKLFNYKILLDLYKLLTQAPPRRLKKPRNIQHGTLQDVRNHLTHSLLSICPAEKILGFQCICDKRYNSITVHEVKSAESLVVVAVHPNLKTIFVSYRPTLTIKNWITDLTYQWVDLPGAPKGVRVHSGFLSHYMTTQKSTHDAVTKLLQNPQLRDYDLLISGFSLGSAIATLSLPHWAKLLSAHNDTRKLHSYIYSGPRVGNEQFAQYIADLNVPITRYTNRNDVVPHLPPRSYGFVHVGAEIHERQVGLLGKVEYRVCSQEYDEDPQCGYSDRFPLSAVRHAIPFGKFIPIPPYC